MKTCKFNTKDFNMIKNQDDINKLDKLIGLIKRDKKKYLLLVIILAVVLKECGICFGAET